MDDPSALLQWITNSGGNHPLEDSFIIKWMIVSGNISTCGESHGNDFDQACGVDAEHLHLYLPRDAGGKVDLLQIFRTENGLV